MFLTLVSVTAHVAINVSNSTCVLGWSPSGEQGVRSQAPSRYCSQHPVPCNVREMQKEQVEDQNLNNIMRRVALLSTVATQLRIGAAARDRCTEWDSVAHM